MRSALAASAPGDEIRVGAGTYLPAPGRASSVVTSGRTLRGGFPAAGGPVSSIDPVLNLTILSGDMGLPADVTDSNYHVVVASNCWIDGFIIEGGNANGAPSHLLGGGEYATGTVTLSQCKIAANKAASGGGVYCATRMAGNSLNLHLCILFANDALDSPAAGSSLSWHRLARCAAIQCSSRSCPGTWAKNANLGCRPRTAKRWTRARGARPVLSRGSAQG